MCNDDEVIKVKETREAAAMESWSKKGKGLRDIGFHRRDWGLIAG